MKKVCVIGSTGSVGVMAVEVCKKLNFIIEVISCNKNIDLLEKQARKYKPKIVCVRDEKYYNDLKERLKDLNFLTVVGGEQAFFEICCKKYDIFLNAVVGIAGLLPTIFALKNNNNVAIANKESLVVGGDIITELAKKNCCLLLPVDSEHSAIFQCLVGEKKDKIKNIILTASGGPFFGKPIEFLKNVTLQDALNHPNWKMGKKITIDSATMINKGFELMEAVCLFGVLPENIKIVIHPQSVLHSAVEYIDSSVIGQFSVPDMRLAIQYALTYPERSQSFVETFSLIKYKELSFFDVDYDMFPCLKLCEDVAKKGGLYPAALNGANERAVELFLQGKIKFLDIKKAVFNVIDLIDIKEKEITVDSIMNVDRMAKDIVDSMFNIYKDRYKY